MALRESDTSYIARAGAIAFDTGGRLFVTDEVLVHTLAFQRNGDFIGSFGKQSSLDDGLVRVMATVPVDTEVVLIDPILRRLVRFGARGRHYLGATKFQDKIRSATVLSSGEVVLGAIDEKNARFLASWRPGDDSLRYLFRFDSVRRPNYRSVWVAAWGDTLIAGFYVAPELYTLVRDRGVIETIFIPVVRRRGSSGRGTARSNTIAEWAALANSSSLTTALQLLSNGRIAVVHQDYRHTGSVLGPSRIFISLLSSDRKQACVDGLVAEGGDGPQSVAFRSDTLFVLQKRRLPGSTRLATELRAYLVDDTNCKWIPIERAGRGFHWF